MISFQPKPTAEHRSLIRDWINELYDLPEDTVVMVAEVNCPEPDCPDVDTVIGLFWPGEPGRKFAITKPMKDVTREDVARLRPRIEASRVSPQSSG